MCIWVTKRSTRCGSPKNYTGNTKPTTSSAHCIFLSFMGITRASICSASICAVYRLLPVEVKQNTVAICKTSSMSASCKMRTIFPCEYHQIFRWICPARPNYISAIPTHYTHSPPRAVDPVASALNLRRILDIEDLTSHGGRLVNVPRKPSFLGSG